MGTWDEDRICEGAGAYYHDFLLDPEDPALPRSVTEHIAQCEHCRRQILRLGEILAEPAEQGGPAEIETDNALIAELQRHFMLLGDEVHCHQVKSLLPTLLIPAVRIKIPTPATVHLDQCPACACDLATLRGLGLGAGQLRRLSRLYGQILDGGAGIPCDLAYERYQEQLEAAGGDTARGTCDHELSTADLFDYLVPNGRAAEGVGEIDRHLQSCPRCLERLGELHHAVFGVLDRADSPVVTVYTTRTAGQRSLASADSPYAGHPIDVRVAGHEADAAAQASSATGVGAAVRRCVNRPRIKPFARIAFLAAAMVPLAIIFWISLPSATALTVAQVSSLIAAASPVHIQTFHPEASGDQPTTDIWIVDETVAVESPREHVIYDLAQGRELDVAPGAAPSQWRSLSGGEIDGIRQYLDGQFRLPQQGGQLQRVVGDADPMPRGAVELWELTWQEPASNGEAAFYRWRVAIEPAARRPQEIEFISDFRGERLTTIVRFSYPDPEEVRAHIRALVGSR